jgi:hypothetical protein
MISCPDEMMSNKVAFLWGATWNFDFCTSSVRPWDGMRLLRVGEQLLGVMLEDRGVGKLRLRRVRSESLARRVILSGQIVSFANLSARHGTLGRGRPVGSDRGGYFLSFPTHPETTTTAITHAS